MPGWVVSLPRNDSIYVKWQTRRRLKWIAKITKTGEGLTADEVADRFLNEIIEQKYPNIDQLERELEHAEEELLTKLAAPAPPPLRFGPNSATEAAVQHL